MTINEISQNFKSGNTRAVYLLHGEEPYFIDKLTELAVENIVPPDFRDFNQSVFYARETEPMQVLDAANRLPMMAEKQLVVLKEAQNWSKATQWEKLEKYLENPSPSTVLVIAYKYKLFDKRTRFYKTVVKHGCIFESARLFDNQVADWITKMIKTKGRTVTDKALMLLQEFVGSDLSRIEMELSKLCIVVPKGEQINEHHVEKNIGISKDYNAFELGNAVLAADYLKAMKIINYFAHNPKAGPNVLVISSLMSTYSNLFKAHFAKTGDPAQLQKVLGVRPFIAREVARHMSKHHPRKISRNFSILRQYDLMSKGYGSPAVEGTELLKELVYKLLN